MNYLYPLNAIHKDGTVELLYTLDEVHNFIRRTGRFHDHYGSWYDITGWYHSNYCEIHDWIVRDDRGRVVKFEDVSPTIPSWHNTRYYKRITRRSKEISHAMELGLPIPGTGCSKAGYKMNHTAKKNSGRGHRNRNRAKAIYEAKEYNVPNNVGNRVIPWEGY